MTSMDARLALDPLSWWCVTPRETFAAVAASRTFTPVDGLHRHQKQAHDYVKPKPETDRRGTHQRFASTDTTRCVRCPRVLTATEQTKGVRRCHKCRTAQPTRTVAA